MNEQVRRVRLGGAVGGVHGSPHRLHHHRLLRRPPRHRRGRVRGDREVGGRGGQRVAAFKIHHVVKSWTQSNVTFQV